MVQFFFLRRQLQSIAKKCENTKRELGCFWVAIYVGLYILTISACLTFCWIAVSFQGFFCIFCRAIFDLSVCSFPPSLPLASCVLLNFFHPTFWFFWPQDHRGLDPQVPGFGSFELDPDAMGHWPHSFLLPNQFGNCVFELWGLSQTSDPCSHLRTSPFSNLSHNFCRMKDEGTRFLKENIDKEIFQFIFNKTHMNIDMSEGILILKNLPQTQGWVQNQACNVKFKHFWVAERICTRGRCLGVEPHMFFFVFRFLFFVLRFFLFFVPRLQKTFLWRCVPRWQLDFPKFFLFKFVKRNAPKKCQKMGFMAGLGVKERLGFPPAKFGLAAVDPPPPIDIANPEAETCWREDILLVVFFCQPQPILKSSSSWETPSCVTVKLLEYVENWTKNSCKEIGPVFFTRKNDKYPLD